jgi:Ca2+-binding RTX toxin-like protein
VNGGTGNDLLVVVNEIPGNQFADGVSTTDFTVFGDGSHSGVFNAAGINDITFSGIERFDYTDLAGGNDFIHTGVGNDTIRAGGGTDTINSGSGIDIIDGGDGIDIWSANMSAATAGITIKLNAAKSQFLGTGEVRNLEGFGTLQTGSGNDAITGHSSAIVNDAILTGGGNDTITLWHGGNDSVNGGAGTDTLIVFNNVPGGMSTQGFTNFGDGSHSGVFNGAGINDITFSGIERFDYTDRAGGNDTIITGRGDDTIRAGGGNDVIDSGSGIDIIDGGAGRDSWSANLSGEDGDVVIDLNVDSTFLDTGRVRNVEGFGSLTTGTGNDAITGHRTSAMADVVFTGAATTRSPSTSAATTA